MPDWISGFNSFQIFPLGAQFSTSYFIFNKRLFDSTLILVKRYNGGWICPNSITDLRKYLKYFKTFKKKKNDIYHNFKRTKQKTGFIIDNIFTYMRVCWKVLVQYTSQNLTKHQIFVVKWFLFGLRTFQHLLIIYIGEQKSFAQSFWYSFVLNTSVIWNSHVSRKFSIYKITVLGSNKLFSDMAWILEQNNHVEKKIPAFVFGKEVPILIV